LDPKEWDANRSSVRTDFGDIAYANFGQGPTALFVHGVFLNGYLWRGVIERLREKRQCIAVDLLWHGHTKVRESVPHTLTAQADMLDAFCQALGLEAVDLVGNDTGGAVAQIFAARYGDRIRTLTLTNCDTHDNYPPEGFKIAVELAKIGQLAPVGVEMLKDPEVARSKIGLGSGYEHPENLSEETIRAYLEPVFSSPDGGRDLEKAVAGADAAELLAIEPELKHFSAPTLVVWGTGDHLFELKWAYWLRDTIPGVRQVVEIDGAKLFFPDERAPEFAAHLRKFWAEEVQE
jgi:pimeloyl-ACP methyl ester carboxylesterase